MAFGKPKETPALPSEGGENMEEEEASMGFGRGRGRGKGRDGAGEYEMVSMREGADENV